MLSLEKGESFTSKGTAVKHRCVIHTCICFLDLMHSHPPPLKLRQRKESRWWGKKEGKPEFLWYKDEQIYNQGGNHMRWSYLSELISKCWITSRFKPQTPRDDSAFCPWTCFLIKNTEKHHSPPAVWVLLALPVWSSSSGPAAHWGLEKNNIKRLIHVRTNFRRRITARSQQAAGRMPCMEPCPQESPWTEIRACY